MEETLGKRIVANRRRLGLTQDALAEQLGVTAQAVSKWENDQSCPDISMVPKLAEIFGITTDELLGVATKEVPSVDIIAESNPEASDKPKGLRLEGRDNLFEFQWDAGRKSSVGTAIWLLLTGAVMFCSNIWGWEADLFSVLWSSGLMLFGLFGLYPRFSVLRLGCALFGGYFLYTEIAPHTLNKEYLLPVFLLLFGLSLLVDGLRKPKKGNFRMEHNGQALIPFSQNPGSPKNHCIYDGEQFECAACFGEGSHIIQLPRLSGGYVECSFGELNVDLSGCGEIADGCCLELSCSFGELELLVPRQYRVEAASSCSFGSVNEKGSPEPGSRLTIYVNCKVSFGDITIRHI